MAKLVTLVTEGATNYLVLPNGQKRNLGTLSPLELVCAFYRNKREIRQLLDRLLKNNSVMFRADLEKLDKMFEPKRLESYPYRRSRWATESPLMDSEICGGAMKGVEQIVRKIEARVKTFDTRVAEGDDVTGGDVQGMQELVEELKAELPKGQSKNDYFYSKKKAEIENELDGAIAKIGATRKIVDRLEAGGRKFNASRVRADLLDVSEKVRKLLANEEIDETEVRSVIGQVDKLHGLFEGAK